jgi:hypothetical protein
VLLTWIFRLLVTNKERSAFPGANHYQGQLETPQSVTAHTGVWPDYRWLQRWSKHITSSSSSSSSSMVLQSNAYLCLLNGLLPVSSVAWSLFPIFSFASINICTQFHHLFLGRPLSRLPWALLLNTWLTFLFTVHSVNMTSPIQMTNSVKSKYIKISKQLL